jgi:hypothetical protein
MDKCERCDQELIEHPLSGELTCFVDGNPNGSDAERKIWEESK